MALPSYEQRIVDFYWENAADKRPRSLEWAAHIHPHMEIIFMEKGDSTAYIGETEYKIGDDDIFLVFPNQVHRYAKGDPCKFHMFIFNPQIVPDFEAMYGNALPSAALLPKGSRYPTMRTLKQLLFAEVKNLSGDSCFDATRRDLSKSIVIRGLLYAFFGEFFSHTSLQKDETSPASDTVELILRYCHKHYKEEISLELLEEKLHLNRFYISHLFRDKIGESFTSYIHRLRTDEACRLLAESDLSLPEISRAVGFSSVRTFDRNFRALRGISPGEYRKGMRP